VHDSFVRLLSRSCNRRAAGFCGTRGADAVIAGKTKQLSGISIRDPHTIDISLDEPLAFFLSLLSMNETSIVPAEEARERERFRTRAVGAGPFRVDEAIEGQHIRLSRNREFYIAGQPHIENLTFRFDLRSGRDVADAFARGELDIAHGIPPKIASEWQRNPRFAPFMLNTTQLHTSYFGYDCSVAPFSRPEVRRAINHAINASASTSASTAASASSPAPSSRPASSATSRACAASTTTSSARWLSCATADIRAVSVSSTGRGTRTSSTTPASSR
jgi:ABC-type transport system substrate-binding protein